MIRARAGTLRWQPKRIVAQRAWAAPPAVFLAGFAVLFLRAPHALLRAEFIIEDGLFYSDALARGLVTVFEPYAGYFVVGHRALTLPQLFVEPYWAPLVANVTAMGVHAAVATYMVFAPLPGSRQLRLGFAALFLLAPAAMQIGVSLSHVQWSIAAWLAMVALARDPVTGRGRAIESAVLVVAALTGPQSLIVLPLFFAGPRRRLAIVAVAAVGHVGVLLAGAERRPPGPIELGEVPYIVALRAILGPVVSPWVGAILPPLGMLAAAAAMAAALFWAAAYIPRWLAWRLLYLAAAPAILGIATNWSRGELNDNLFIGTRYFWPASVAVGWIIAVNFPRRSVIGGLLAICLAVGVVIGFRHPTPVPANWAKYSACIGGPVACTVYVAGSPEDRWAVHWIPDDQ